MAEQQPEVLEQLQEVALRSRFDETQQGRVVKTIDEVLGAIDQSSDSS